MGLLTAIMAWPLVPLRGVVWLAERIQEQAEREFNNPMAVRRQLEEIEAARAAGEISEEEQNHLYEQVLQRVTGNRR
ncbi:gas vesicle protein GvpG [Nonomuraea zeae]|uniref:Gas vesicle protein G n=1 Tax=Nonomuraea zeae TaxID=1642303 RepID=A0A5S4G6K4_9ACTN|nr:gas vesicle protein GvpG [Nonomuraea zeae]TMR28479.1 gas vesicle protein G [Nonomuraea zeae]